MHLTFKNRFSLTH